MDDPVEERLRNAAKAVKDDIRGAYKLLPKYRDYLASLLTEAADEIDELRKPTPSPDD